VDDAAGADEGVVALLDAEWRAIDELCQGLDDAQWELPTDCPGWTVKDNVSHLIGIENMLRGAPADPPITERPAHVRNDFGAFNEAAVAARRARPGTEVLAEFRAVARERIDALRALPAEKWDEVGPTPTGQDTYRHFMRMRTFDSWVHEQDIRRAVGRPGHLEGPVVELVLGWHRRNLGYLVAKRAGAPEGSVVAFDVRGDGVAERDVIQVVDGRGRPIDDDATPDATLVLDVEAYNALLCGRWDAPRALDAGRLRLDGDEQLGRRVADSLAYLF
jgi:uncharacterized protein (TIGR03083 family)